MTSGFCEESEIFQHDDSQCNKVNTSGMKHRFKMLRAGA